MDPLRLEYLSRHRHRPGLPQCRHYECQPGHCKYCEGKIGSPINLANGNVYVDQADYSLPGLGGGIQIARTWNSQWESVNPVERSGTFGNSWRSTYDERLVIPTGATGPRTIQYWLSDGSEWTFQATPSGSTYTVASPLDEHATLQADITQTSYTMTFTDGTRKTFNNGGYLTAITDRNGNKTAINYDAANRITNVTDAAGRVLTFNYGPALRCGLLETLIVRNIVGAGGHA
jgi:YD repeat-containing protein